MATSLPRTVPLNTEPKAPEPILESRLYMISDLSISHLVISFSSSLSDMLSTALVTELVWLSSMRDDGEWGEAAAEWSVTAVVLLVVAIDVELVGESLNDDSLSWFQIS
ncbi:hypothetical protein SAMD00019534_000960 [Acytostelium subglobosum LB1]|uniref:hypothetical protein n=1 Tax=Acytostelium subglobosum LB1 TaxID=1410327 RepID=UPI000645232B|nr:hypothetical protein SAMD00019534_000960 [Acytostelium subglobosum LB1]GAM16921.1 hypothetical protein SAMD00019534_000960 [Acytostelium subglobosum LB1]|eukprot:XP_012758983.1 hypothetical protein SAMD00019534_000960 [Acytostelium subglobosum LB1]